LRLSAAIACVLLDWPPLTDYTRFFFAELRAYSTNRRRHLKAKLKRADFTYEELARLKKHGFKETKASIANKLARATMSAHFYLASLVAIGREQVTLEEI
jgi:Domain of unknown function (DUF6471)